MKRGDIVTIYRSNSFINGEWFYISYEAKVMGVIDGYAMLRRKGRFPFVESVKVIENRMANPPKQLKESPDAK